MKDFYSYLKEHALAGTGISMYVLRVTPQLANEIIKNHNAKNRNVSPSNVKKISKKIASGEWRLNGETIVFDRHGLLMDGQHRLEACIEARTPIITCAIFGVDYETTFCTVDSGRSRTGGDVLDISGRNNGRNLIAALRWVYRYENGMITPFSIRSPYPTFQEIPNLLDFAAKHGSMPEFVGVKLCGLISPSVHAALCYLFSKKDAILAAEFQSIKDIQTRHNFILFREALIKNSQNKKKLPDAYMFCLAIKAWNFERAGRIPGHLRINSTEQIQVIA